MYLESPVVTWPVRVSPFVSLLFPFRNRPYIQTIEKRVEHFTKWDCLSLVILATTMLHCNSNTFAERLQCNIIIIYILNCNRLSIVYTVTEGSVTRQILFWPALPSLLSFLNRKLSRCALFSTWLCIAYFDHVCSHMSPSNAATICTAHYSAGALAHACMY